jgi:HAD superfamily hydrolase (TIGR01509 family)
LAVPPPWRINLEPFAAVIFDMDGVLVDGEPLHFRAVNQLLAPEGLSLSLEQYKPYMGTKAGWRDMAADLGLASPPDHYSERYDELILEQYRTETRPLPGAVELVRALQRCGLPLGLCSSSRKSWVDACLDRLGLADAFNGIVTGSDVTEGKPAPDIYLLAARTVSQPAARCLAIEDAPAGIESATRAGMTCWAVRTEYTRGLALPPVARVLESLTDVDPCEIAGVAA